MGRRITDRQILADKVNRLCEAEVRDVLEYIEMMRSLHGEVNRPDFFDDLGCVDGAVSNDRSVERQTGAGRSIQINARRAGRREV